MFKPASTYRIQFHKHFNFSDFEEIIPYLHALGIDTIYASPIFKAVPGSMHGYDSVDPTSINPEIGTEKQLVTIAKRLKQFGMHWIQDIVPNHMAFHTENPWLMDVLKNGIYSPYFNYFDIGLPIATENEPILLPFLGTSLNDALANNELKIALEDSELKLESGGNKWPLNLKAYAIVFNKLPRQEPCLRLWEKWFCKHDNALEKGIPKDFFNDFSESLKNKEFKGAVQDAVNQINNDLTELTQIIDAQFYRLCNWQETDKKINYRRFFTVNALICLNIQHPQVFEWYHAYCIRLIEKGIISGLRIDHIDGLADPTAYLLKLREAVGDDIYIVAEKILHQHEELPINWPIQGNTGYDFLAMVNNLLTNKGAEHAFSKTYEQFTGKKLTVRKEIARKKADILFKHMAGELDNLTQLFIKLGLAKESELRKLPENALREVIGNFLIYCPVYRYYGNSFPLNKTEKKLVEAIFKSIPHEEKHQSALRLVKKALFTLPINDKSYANRAKLFYQRCMQFTGPLTAKGVEDTLMYTYNRFIAHDEVGDSPDFFGLAVADFHKLMKIRQKRWPLSLNGTSTHDTKRGEDVRARLNVLTALPNNWDEWVRIFEKGATALERKSDKFKTLHQNDLYLIYQTLIGIWPMPGEEDKNLAQRVSDYIEKALREAKKRSNWNTPDENYEEIAKHFALNFVDSKNSFVATINNEISDFGIVNSLAQLILKLTCPGIPDFYQGTELWDFSLVDPDNRKAIDYDLRKNNLKELENLDLNELWKERYNGKIKTWITQTGLLHRKEFKEIYENGQYVPLVVKGTFAKHLIAFARSYKNEWIIAAIPLGLAAICKEPNQILDFDWKDTSIVLPKGAPSNWKNIFTKFNTAKDVLTDSLYVKSLFKKLPFAILKSYRVSRGAGLLLSISSLPSAFGIGDMGPEAYKFIDFLAETKQKYWQILPLNPTCKEQLHSSYSSQSSMAGNVFFISPESLLNAGLLSANDLNNYRRLATDKIDYDEAEQVKMQMLAVAYSNFMNGENRELMEDFVLFCKKEQEWLADYVVYLAIKEDQNQRPWDHWPKELRNKKTAALNEISLTYQGFIEEQKWRQFIFHRQWHKLKAYALQNGIQLIGDLPFYVAFDSADVWANQELFKLDENNNMLFSAGVPPDYFNADGQVWGMPVYNWDVHKAQHYRWWIKRMRRNLSLTDLLRLDHFRGFDTFWQIPAEEKTAINGTWEQAPGLELFKTIQENLGELPFIAEDLGELTQSLIDFRAQLALPGMKVLQFAFDEEMSANPHIPHQFESENFVVYSGTHDNNTSKGWFSEDLTSMGKERLSKYIGKKATISTIHKVIAMLAYQSIAKICILPMQDVLGLSSDSRLNTPASTTENWVWRLKADQINPKVKQWLLKLTEMYNRD